MGVYVQFVRRNAVWLAVLILAAIPALAQLPTGTILGTVKDSSGASIPGAMVTLRNTDTNLTKTAMTEADGSYRFPELPVGHYEVKAEAAGFRTETRTGLNLEVTQQGVINFALQVGATTQTVTITSDIPLVNTQDSTLGGTVNEQQMAQLPLNGRNYIDLTLLKPGVNKDVNQRNQANGTTFSVNGAPPRSNNFTLDGAILQTADGRSPVAGDSGNALGLDGIKEYQTVTGTFQAEYGLAMGSQIVAVSKGGTNQFHGDVFEYLRNSAFDANTFFNRGAGTPKVPLEKNQFGAAFGGPIKKDKTFFYAVFEGVRQNEGVAINNPVPSPGCHPPASAITPSNPYGAGAVITLANCPDLSLDTDGAGNPITSVTLSKYTAPFLAIVPLPSPGQVWDPVNQIPPSQISSDVNKLSENYGQMRLDQNFSSNDTFFGRYTIDNAFLNQTQADYSYFRNTAPARNQWVTIAENHTFSPTVLNTARFSFSRTRSASNLLNNGLTQNNGLGPELVSGNSTGIVDLGGSGGGPYQEFGSVNAAPTTFSLQNIYTLSDDVNWTRGKHAFKFGTLLNRFNQGDQATNSYNGQIIFGQLSDFFQDVPLQVEFAPTWANENRFFIYNTYGFYLQDDWRATSRLTVNLGLRYEFMSTPRELQGKQSHQVNDYTDLFAQGPIIQNNSLHDFSPRVGMAYDLFGNGKTAIRGGAGIYYDMGNIGSSLGGTTNGAIPFGALIDINPGCSSGFFNANNTAHPLGTPGFQPCTIGDWESVLGTATPIPGGSPNAPSGTGGFPLPYPQQVLSSYPPTCQPGPGVFAQCTTNPGLVTPTFIDYNWKSSYMIQYNASVQQQLPFNMAIGVAYVGNHGLHLPQVRDGNPIYPTSFGPCGDPASLCVDGKVPFWDTGSPAYQNVNPFYGSDINIATLGVSRYNALQIVLEKRTSHGLEFESSFTHSKVTDQTQGQANIQDCVASGGLLGTYPLDPRIDRGPACFNVPNNWEFNVLYHFPSPQGGFKSKALGGWFMSSIVSVQGGLPITPLTTNNRSNSGVLQGGQGDWVNINTPQLLAAYPCTSQPGQTPAGANPCPFYQPIPYNPNTVVTGNVNQWINPAMFSIPPITPSPASEQASCPPGTAPCNFIGQLGDAGRNILSGPPERDWDFSLVKDTKLGFLGEGGMLEFRAEFFNILNHPSFNGGGINTFIFKGNTAHLTPFSDQPQSTNVTKQLDNNQREIQFALRLEF